MITDIVIGLVNVLGWSIKPLIEKEGIKHSSFFIFANTRYVATAMICIIVLLACKRKYITDNINYKSIVYSIIVSIIGLLSIISNYYLLSKYDANFVVGLVDSSIILTSLLLSYLFFNEIITTMRIVGISIISIGILITFLSK